MKNNTGYLQISRCRLYELATLTIEAIKLDRKFEAERLHKRQLKYWSKPTGLMWIMRWGQHYTEEETLKRMEEVWNDDSYYIESDLRTNPTKQANKWFTTIYEECENIKRMYDDDEVKEPVTISLELYGILTTWVKWLKTNV
jgi:hypothetical protein